VDNREFFERQIIDSTRYAGNFGLRNKLVPAAFFFSSTRKNIGRQTRPSQDYSDDEFGLSLNNESKFLGQTYFSFNRDKFSRVESDIPDQDGVAQDFNLSNTKSLFNDPAKLLNSSLYFYDLAGTSKSSIFNYNELLDIKHTDYLSSIYSYGFQDRNSSGARTRDNRLNASLRHKLYESLASTVSSHYFKSDATDFSENNYGLSWDEDYLKRLGKIGRLNLDWGLNYLKDQRKAPSGVISIIDEVHTLTTGVVTYLNNPQANTATVVVTDSSGSTTYTINLDYQLTKIGERTQIQRVPGGSIADGAGVMVDYQAESSSLFKFSTLGQYYNSRIDFLDDLFGIFYRLNKKTHPMVKGDQNAILQTLTDTIFGVVLHYKNLEVEFEDQDYDSNLAPYKQLKLRERLVLNLSQMSQLTLQSSQSKIRLVDTQELQDFFDVLGRYTMALNRYSRFNLEAGYRWQKGAGIDLNDIAANTGYEINLGKLFMSLEYAFKRQLYLKDTLVNHFVSTRIKRKF